MHLAISPRLRKSPMFREARSGEWREVSWDFAMDWFVVWIDTRHDLVAVLRWFGGEADEFFGPLVESAQLDESVTD